MGWESISVPDNFSNPDTWRSILKEWIELMRFFSVQPDNTEKDIPYWYGERPLTGLLSAAAWRLENEWVLEEFSTLRGQEEEGNTGRVDLWFGVDEKVYTVEAKLTWPENDL